MLQMTKEQEAQYIKSISPFHYCWELPSGIRTGDSAPNLFPEKMPLLIAGGAFSKPQYPEVLDLGANSGFISKWFVDEKGSHVIAIERGKKYFPQLVHVINVFGLESRIEPRNENIEDCKFNNGDMYDLIIFLGTLHYIGRAHHKAIFDACYDCLKPGGEIVIQTKREEEVLSKLISAGFEGAREVYWSDQQDRGAWMGGKE